MYVVSPLEFFHHSSALATRHGDGLPQQVDLRRAISAAYYGIFHAILTAAADEFVGTDPLTRKSQRYTLVYRSVDHGALRQLCEEVKKPQPSRRYQKYFPSGGFDSEMQMFASLVLELQGKRHEADYDPSQWFSVDETRLTIATAKVAFQSLTMADKMQRSCFLTLLLFPPR